MELNLNTVKARLYRGLKLLKQNVHEAIERSGKKREAGQGAAGRPIPSTARSMRCVSNMPGRAVLQG